MDSAKQKVIQINNITHFQLFPSSLHHVTRAHQKSHHPDLLKPCEQKLILSSRAQQDGITETAHYCPQFWWQVGLAAGVTLPS